MRTQDSGLRTQDSGLRTQERSLITSPAVCARCSRYLLPHLSAQNASSLLDAGLSYYEDKLDPYLKHTKSKGCPQVSST